MKVYFIGAGKVGRALSSALRREGVATTLRSFRKGVPKRWPSADLIVVAVRDGDIGGAARALSDLPGAAVPVVHCAGALGPEALAPLAPAAQMHPLLSFASSAKPPALRGAFMRVTGDPPAVKQARRLAKALGMIAGELEGVEPAMYHAAAALCANGAAALVGQACRLLALAGCDPVQAPVILGPLLASVAHNTVALGLPEALTGPVRRGDGAAVRAHLKRLREHAPDMVPLYLALTAAQLDMARQLGEAPLEKFDDIADVTSKGRRT